MSDINSFQRKLEMFIGGISDDKLGPYSQEILNLDLNLNLNLVLTKFKQQTKFKFKLVLQG